MSATFIAERPDRDAVAAGARLLDQLDAEDRRHGVTITDWNLEVDLTVLDLEEDHLCVLGQRYGHFVQAPIFVGPTYHADMLLAKMLGFWALATPGEEDDPDDPGNVAHLSARWREEIAARNAQRALAEHVLAA